MLGERIANLRKERKVSQEELADVLNTSRQAISKWERGESDPDIDRLKDLAIYFGVSIDYLLGYDLESTSVNNFIERIKENFENKKLDISIDEIRLIVSKNSNNFVLLCYVLMYLQDYCGIKHQLEINDLSIEIGKKAIAAYQVDNSFSVSLNDIHKLIVSCYIKTHKYDLAKEFCNKGRTLIVHCAQECPGHGKTEKNISNLKIYLPKDLTDCLLDAHNYILVDEAHRIYGEQFKKICESARKLGHVCILSSDPGQSMSTCETIDKYIQKWVPEDNHFKLAGSVRTNKELFSFINRVKDLNFQGEKKEELMDYSCVELNKVNSQEEAKLMLEYYKSKDYIFINYTDEYFPFLFGREERSSDWR